MKKKPDESLYEAHCFLRSAKANDPKFAKEREAAEERLSKHMYALLNHGSNFGDLIGARISRGKKLAKQRRLQEQQAENGPMTRIDDAVAKEGKRNGRQDGKEEN